MNELLDFDNANDPKLQKFIRTTLNTVKNKHPEKIIRVDGTVGDNYKKKPLERNEPSTSEVMKKKPFKITEDKKKRISLGLPRLYRK